MRRPLTVGLLYCTLFALASASPLDTSPATNELQKRDSRGGECSFYFGQPSRDDCWSTYLEIAEAVAKDPVMGGENMSLIDQRHPFMWREKSRDRFGARAVLPRTWQNGRCTIKLLQAGRAHICTASWKEILAAIQEILHTCVSPADGLRRSGGWAFVGDGPLIVELSWGERGLSPTALIPNVRGEIPETDSWDTLPLNQFMLKALVRALWVEAQG